MAMPQAPVLTIDLAYDRKATVAAMDASLRETGVVFLRMTDVQRAAKDRFCDVCDKILLCCLFLLLVNPLTGKDRMRTQWHSPSYRHQNIKNPSPHAHTSTQAQIRTHKRTHTPLTGTS